MNSIHIIIKQVEAFAEAHNMRPDLVCRRATGNPYLLDRLRRRADQVESDIERLRAFMADASANPATISPHLQDAQKTGGDA